MLCYILIFDSHISVGAVLEHEAIAGLSAGRPSGLRGRLQSNSSKGSQGGKDFSLESIIKAVSKNKLLKD